jgi:hypothetical protein
VADIRLRQVGFLDGEAGAEEYVRLMELAAEADASPPEMSAQPKVSRRSRRDERRRQARYSSEIQRPESIDDHSLAFAKAVQLHAQG